MPLPLTTVLVTIAFYVGVVIHDVGAGAGCMAAALGNELLRAWAGRPARIPSSIYDIPTAQRARTPYGRTPEDEFAAIEGEPDAR